MEGFKAIPQIFFDIIGRVVPGLVFIVLWLYFSEFELWAQFVKNITGLELCEIFKGIKDGPGGLLLFILFVFCFSGYMVGHLLSPLTKIIQGLFEVKEKTINLKPVNDFINGAGYYSKSKLEKLIHSLYDSRVFKPIGNDTIVDVVKHLNDLVRYAENNDDRINKDDGSIDRSVNALKDCLKNTTSTESTGSIESIESITVKFKILSPSKDYDWLRLHYPEAGGLCAKLRAEFTMYNGLAGVFFIYFVLFSIKFFYVDYVKFAPQNENISCFSILYEVLFVILLLVLSYSMASRGREGRDTFASSVIRFKEAAVSDHTSVSKHSTKAN
ncbi:MAG: hypothetical protein ACU836_13800 [Gammaproteobacteria bacterium]